MGALQTTFTADVLPAFPGQWADIMDTEAVSRIAEHSALPFGIAVVRGSKDHLVRLPDAGDVLGHGATTEADNAFMGIVMYHAGNPAALGDPLTKPTGDGDKSYIARTESASLQREGRVWVVAEVAVKQNDPVFYRVTLTDPAASPQTEQLGMLTNTADAGNCIEIPGCKWVDTKAAGELSKIDFSGV